MKEKIEHAPSIPCDIDQFEKVSPYLMEGDAFACN
jgi:hypothetical protein